MFKKFLLLLICTLFITSANVFAAPKDIKSQIKPLKVEQNYKYGNIEKSLKSNAKRDSYADIEDDSSRKTTSALDIINTVLLTIFALLLLMFLFARARDVSIKEVFKTKKKDNKFNILSVESLSDGKTLYLVEVNGREIIVGATASKVDSIMPLDKSYSTEEIPPEYIEKLFEDTMGKFKNLEE